ncbi:flagellar protein FliT [Lacrimispora saccharolytica]|uniref:Uncharacterized protein n=1 Tax=Lacrimispora saccharolytica (strain ATCC 35040 / DSM 2544 / NRCC 2533 / WM1) TaxID=610130 RepID=D9R2L7_LACSW|nr:flagellar protein FliT [Lacrimispora saccharolytica]ADL06641.1 hypothetical protein Closa_4135 [[Clostridium] saccharolyticum WM1]QRV19287.1 flagellar protein FliT [Lacrimispora saccharolytica]
MEIKVQEPTAAGAPIGETGAGDIQRAVEEADIRGKIEAGERFMEELSRNVEESREKTSRENNEDTRDTREARPGRDTDKASLSEESAYYKLSPEELTDLDKMWGKENADLAWADILAWSPSAAKNFSDELAALAGIYKELLRAILANTMAGVQEGQLAALDAVLSDILMKVLEARMGELGTLLGKYGSQSSMIALKAALYRSVTGNTLSPGELELVFKGQPGSAGDLTSFNPGSIRIPVNESGNDGEQGMIYQPAGEGRIKNDPQYAQRMRREVPISVLDGMGIPGSKPDKAQGVQTSITSMGKNPVYSSDDLESAERFAGYINRRGNLLKASGLSGGSEELYGFLAAVMAMKSQTYGAYSGINKGLAADLREAVDRMIDYYIQDAFKQSESIMKRSGSRSPLFQPRAAYKVYYYMMNLYQTTRDLRETVNKGIRHAYQQFLKNKECLEDRKDSGSFFTREKKDPREDWKEGKKIVERDWKEFLSFMGREDLGGIPIGIMELSPWGMLAEPEPPSERGGRTATPVFLAGAGIVILILILFFSFF